MDVRQRLRSLLAGLPLAQRVGLGVVVVALAMLVMVFFRWLTTPGYAVLYTGLDDQALAAAISELDTSGVPYRIDAGGSTLLVPRNDLYSVRARLAEAGVGGATAVEGYELLDEQGFTISDFRQKVDYRRALEGELARTLMAMDSIGTAEVHIVLPDNDVFDDEKERASASVLLDTTRPLDAEEVDAVVFLISSSVEGLEPGSVTVADADGAVLRMPGGRGDTTGLSSQRLRQTREFEQAMAADLNQLLRQATGSPVSVVVRATLDFDQTETETETYEPGTGATVLREQVSTEEYEGTGAPPGGTVGVDGGPVDTAATQDNRYVRDDTSREFGVGRTVTRSVDAPGRVERLSVAIVADDGTAAGAGAPADDLRLENLVRAAAGLDEARGDEVVVTRVAMAAAEDEEAEEAQASLMDDLPTYVGAAVVLIVAVGLLLMSRRGGKKKKGDVEVASVQVGPGGGAAPVAAAPTEVGAGDQQALAQPEPPPDLKSEVALLAEDQPEVIAELLRGWLSDRSA